MQQCSSIAQKRETSAYTGKRIFAMNADSRRLLLRWGFITGAVSLAALLVLSGPSPKTRPSDQAQAKIAQVSQPMEKHAHDPLSDELPKGAIARLGSMHFRAAHTNSALAFSPGGEVLASAGAGSINLWDANTGRFLRSLPIPHFGHPPPRLSFSGDGKKLSVTGVALSLSDLTSGKELAHFARQGGTWPCFALSPDGHIAALAPDTKKAPVVTFWDLSADKEIGHLMIDTGSVHPVVFSPDGKTLATGGPGRTVRLWDVASGQQFHLLEKNAGRIDAMAFAPGGKVLACSIFGGSNIKFWSVETGQLLHQLPAEADAIYTNLQFSPDGKLVATAGEGKALVLWDAETGKEVRRWFPHADWVTALAFSPDGKVLASTGFRDFGIRRWEVASGKEISPLTGHTGPIDNFVFTPDGQTLFSVSDGDKRVRQWDLATGVLQDKLFAGPIQPNADDRWWNASGLSPDGKMVAFMPQIWDKQGMNSLYVIRLVDTRTGKEIGLLEGHKGHNGWVKFSPDGKHLASSTDDGVHLWEVATRKKLRHYPEHWCPAFSPDGIVLAANSFQPIRGVIDFWEVSTGKKLRHWQNPELKDLNLCVFSPDGAYLAMWDFYGKAVHVRSAATGNEYRTFEKKALSEDRIYFGRRTAVMFGPVFSRTGRILATAMYDGSITLWDMLSGAEIRRIDTGQSGLNAVAFAPGDRILVTGGADSSILLWDLTGFDKSGELAPPAMTAADQAAYWSDLTRECAKAERAHWAFALSPQQSLPYLRERLLAVHDPKQIARFIGDLDSKSYSVRNKATQALEEIGPAAKDALLKALDEKPTLEYRQRVLRLLQKHEQQLYRQLRAVDALEHMGTDESWQALKELANKSGSKRVVAAAASALKRRVE